MNNPNDIIAFGEAGWLARLTDFADTLDSGYFANRVADILRAQPDITDAVAGIDSIAIRFDPKKITAATAHKLLSDALERTPRHSEQPASPIIEIPVCYSKDFGPDADHICTHCSLAPDQLIALHTAGDYRVVTLGFAPGFAYLSGLSPALDVPRLETPRTHVPRGSIAIAGGFAGLYALPSPGGWNIIGRTPKILFDASSSSPFVLKPGSSVRFTPISEDEFYKLGGTP